MTYSRECPGCGCKLTWTPRYGAGSSLVPGTWTGEHAEHCREPHDGTPDQTFNPEQTIGPNGAPLYVVTCSFHRLGTPNGTHVETVQVRADSYDGAILLARELFPEAMIDAEAQLVQERTA